MLLVGRLRSEWLPSPLARRIVILVPKLALGFSTGVVHWWVNAMAVRSGFASVSTFHLVINIVFGLVVGLAERLRAIVRVSAWMVYGSIVGVVNVKLMPVDGPVSAAAHILYFVIIFVIAGELVVRFLGGELEPVERLSFSWERARLYLPKASVRGLGVGLLLSLIIGLSAWPPGISWTDALIFGLIYGLIFGVVWGLIQGLARGASSAPIPTHVTPNEEIRNIGTERPHRRTDGGNGGRTTVPARGRTGRRIAGQSRHGLDGRALSGAGMGTQRDGVLRPGQRAWCRGSACNTSTPVVGISHSAVTVRPLAEQDGSINCSTGASEEGTDSFTGQSKTTCPVLNLSTCFW